MEEIHFANLIVECMDSIIEHVSSGVRLEVHPTIGDFLFRQPRHEIVQGVVLATHPAEQLMSLVTTLIGPLEATSQGVFADILTNDADQSAKKIHIVAAAGPYNSWSAGMRGRAQRLELKKKSKKHSVVPYYQAVCTPGWRSNWAPLATFMAPVDKEMVIITHAIMAILFGSYPRNGYVVCRPKPLVPVPLNWGLNEISPLRLNALKTYFKGLDTEGT